MSDLRRYEVELTINHPEAPEGSLYISFISGVSPEAAKRRALWQTIAYYRHLDLTPDNVVVGRVVSAPYQPEEGQ